MVSSVLILLPTIQFTTQFVKTLSSKVNRKVMKEKVMQAIKNYEGYESFYNLKF